MMYDTCPYMAGKKGLPSKGEAGLCHFHHFPYVNNGNFKLGHCEITI